MKLQQGTIEEFAKILTRLGEASIVGSVASIFIQSIRFSISVLGFCIETLLIFNGLYFYNIAKEKVNDKPRNRILICVRNVRNDCSYWQRHYSPFGQRKKSITIFLNN